MQSWQCSIVLRLRRLVDLTFAVYAGVRRLASSRWLFDSAYCVLVFSYNVCCIRPVSNGIHSSIKKPVSLPLFFLFLRWGLPYNVRRTCKKGCEAVCFAGVLTLLKGMLTDVTLVICILRIILFALFSVCHSACACGFDRFSPYVERVEPCALGMKTNVINYSWRLFPASNVFAWCSFWMQL